MMPQNDAEFSPRALAALERLREGNARFVQHETTLKITDTDRRNAVDGQNPVAVVLGCSDSRVPTEVVFDQGVGELFVIRVAGNVVSPEIMGTLQYAGVHLRTPLFVVLGHESCSAINAALAAKHGGQEPARIAMLLDNILPGLRDLPPDLTPDAEVRAAVEANVRW